MSMIDQYAEILNSYKDGNSDLIPCLDALNQLHKQGVADELSALIKKLDEIIQENEKLMASERLWTKQELIELNYPKSILDAATWLSENKGYDFVFRSKQGKQGSRCYYRKDKLDERLKEIFQYVNI